MVSKIGSPDFGATSYQRSTSAPRSIASVGRAPPPADQPVAEAPSAPLSSADEWPRFLLSFYPVRTQMRGRTGTSGFRRPTRRSVRSAGQFRLPLPCPPWSLSQHPATLSLSASDPMLRWLANPLSLASQGSVAFGSPICAQNQAGRAISSLRPPAAGAMCRTRPRNARCCRGLRRCVEDVRPQGRGLR